jgi:hypothetical protein
MKSSSFHVYVWNLWAGRERTGLVSIPAIHQIHQIQSRSSQFWLPLVRLSNFTASTFYLGHIPFQEIDLQVFPTRQSQN